jgi:O-acetyl-ADP-ribose deacetylase (regulator of RNase III)
MITFTKGDLFESQAEALVNTVNCVGVMGKGIALQFKQRFHDNFRAYEEACAFREVQEGKMFVTQPTEQGSPRLIINFPTKKHWRNPSKLEWIEAGLKDLRRFLIEQKVQSVAIPALGAGLGGLDWKDVRRLIERELAGLETEIVVYEAMK